MLRSILIVIVEVMIGRDGIPTNVSGLDYQPHELLIPEDRLSPHIDIDVEHTGKRLALMASQMDKVASGLMVFGKTMAAERHYPL